MVKVQEKYFKTKYRTVGALVECLHWADLNLNYSENLEKIKTALIIVSLYVGLH